MSVLSNAARSVRNLRDLSPVLLRIWQPNASLRAKLVGTRGSILVAGQQVPYAAFVACDFSLDAPPLVMQLGYGTEVAA